MGFADKLTNGMLDCCNAEFKQRGGFSMTRENLRDILRGHDQRRFCRMLLRDYAEAVEGADHGLDTYERGYLFDIFAERVAGVTHWPMNMDGDEMNAKFMENLRLAVKAGKIEIVEV